MRKNDILIFIPTYNERENVEPLLLKIVELKLDADILFMDDNSPDGTGAILDELAIKHDGVKVIHREGKLGIGSAHQEGIRWAYKNNYKKLITMDCDFTHPPEYIAEVLKKAENYDIVVGSRYLLKNSLKGWSILRKIITRVGHLLTTFFLRMKYDASGAFRYYRLDKIPPYAFDLVSSTGYSFFYESLFVLNFNKFSIKEIAIILPARTSGHSKMQLNDAFESLAYLFSIYINTLFNKEKYTVSEPYIPESNAPSPFHDKQGWDNYWKNQKSTGGLVYDAIAAFYRKFIIKRALNHYINKYFKRGDVVLHAGCGSGQVDTDVRDRVSIIALDISLNALSLYKKINGGKCKLFYGSISDIQLSDNSVDGVYNLGVMEHFTEDEIQEILVEFHRVLNPTGKIVIFWPPEFGLSVIFLKFVTFILTNVLRKKNVSLHPPEITRIKSKKHADHIFGKANFRIIESYFGIRDFFTHIIVVCERM